MEVGVGSGSLGRQGLISRAEGWTLSAGMSPDILVMRATLLEKREEERQGWTQGDHMPWCFVLHFPSQS